MFEFYTMEKTLEHLLRTIIRTNAEKDAKPTGDVIKVSDTISVAASVYEVVRNTLEYDEDHRLRRNAVRRILKRRLGDGDTKKLSSHLLRELIWARYLPNKTVPEVKIGEVENILKKYQPLFETLNEIDQDDQEAYEWLMDVLASEIEYCLVPSEADDALANYAYQELRNRMEWSSKMVKKADRDLQLFIAVRRAVLKSNAATLRYRVLTLFYPDWNKATAEDAVVKTIKKDLKGVIEKIEGQIGHPAADHMFRLVRKHAVVFHLIKDVAADDPEAFYAAFEKKDVGAIEKAITRAADDRYKKFRVKLVRGVVRAVFFLFITKMLLALLIEAPYEHFVLHVTNYVPLIVNILFPPFLLSVLGFTVVIPAKRNTEKILEEVRGLMGADDDFQVLFKMRRPWTKGPAGIIFKVLYVFFFLFTIGVISTVLRLCDFNVLSILFFLFFLSLVAFFGLKLRYSKRDLVIVESRGSVLAFISDILFLPIVRAGRWMALRAPKVNIFLFFFDFIVEAPFKAAIGIIESWLAFLREKREEIG